MTWQEAIKQSPKGTAQKTEQSGLRKYTFIRYDDGSVFRLVSIMDKVMFDLSGPHDTSVFEGMEDWEPTP